MVAGNSSLSKSIACLFNVNNQTNSISTREATVNECRFARLAGSLLLIVAVLSFLINTRALFLAKRHRRLSQRDASLVIAMFISSLLVILISVPSVVVQCFSCYRLCIPLICHLEGFNSFFQGCVTMYLLVSLSIVRLATTANTSVSINIKRRLEEHSHYFVLICFILSGVWAIPPLFGRVSAYVPEGLGFHCGLDWFDRSFLGRVYFFLLFINVFFLPIGIVIYVNLYIQRTIYRITHLKTSVILDIVSTRQEENFRRHVSHSLFNKEAQRLHRLHDDRRFVLATGISIIIYLIAWTPYSLVAIAQLFGDQFFTQKPWLMTTGALLAKLSMITNPIIFMVILETKHTKSRALVTINS